MASSELQNLEKSVKDSWNREEVKNLLYKAFAEQSNTGKAEFDKWIEENL